MFSSKLWLALLLPISLHVGSHAQDGIQQGVIVERVMNGSAAQRAGLQEGDVVFQWNRHGNEGSIESPFDLSNVDIEQALRGTVVLRGLGSGEARAWTMGADKWGIQTRPILPEPALSIYREGQVLNQNGKRVEAARRWQAASEEVQKLRQPATAAWLLAKAGKSFAEAGSWPESDLAFQEALHQADAAKPWVAPLLLEDWAKTFEQRKQWSEAESRHAQALEKRRRTNPESLAAAESLMNLAELAWNREQISKAEQYIAEALAIREKVIPESLSVAWCVNDLGLIAWRQGDLVKAENYHTHALAIRQRLAPGSLDVAASLDNLVIVERERGDPDAADKHLQEILAIREKLEPDSIDVSITLNNLGNAAWDRGNLSKAGEYYQRELAIVEKLKPESAGVAVCLANLANVALAWGDLVTAEKQFQRALAIEEKVAPNGLTTAGTLMNLSMVAQARGDLEEADKLVQKAIAIQKQQASDSVGMAEMLANLGAIAGKKGEWQRATEYERRAIILWQKLAPESLGMADSLSDLGTVAWRLGNIELAQEHYERALRIREKLAPQSLSLAKSLNHLADVSESRSNLVRAQEFRRRALDIVERLAPATMLHAESAAGLAVILHRQGQDDAAAPLFAKALDVLEAQIAHLGGSEDAHIGVRNDHASYYSDFIDLLMGQNKPDLALAVAERSRARSLIEVLAEAQIDIRQGVDLGLLERVRALRELVAIKSNRRVRLLAAGRKGDQIADVEKEIAEARAQYEVAAAQVRTTSPGYAALTHPQPLSAKEIQQLLDDDTVLLEYALGKGHSYVWAITPTSLVSRRLPSATQLEALARRAYKLLSPAPTTRAAEIQREKRLRTAVSNLSQVILGPVAPELAKKRLLIVADGALQYIPFAALVSPDSGKATGIPLFLEHEIVALPSASIVAELRRENMARHQVPKTVAVLADPVFDVDDPRVQRPGQRRSGIRKPPTYSEQLSRSATDVGLLGLPRLPFTRREADSILAAIPLGQGMAALGFDASRSTATSPELAQYRIVHFATHALSDSLHPEWSGLVLSMVDQRGNPQNGFLGLQDIYNLNLPAELVVLSGCETGLGKEVKGEGLIGLTRGFMYAGATRVVASLWKVNDIATKEFMQRFYKSMVLGQLTPAAALKQAQMEMWAQRRWHSPYYWAAFQLQGEWRSSSGGPKEQSKQ